MRTLITVCTLVIATLAGQACNKNAAAPPAKNGAAGKPAAGKDPPPGHAPLKMVASAGGGSAGALGGTVAETLDAGGYTYLKIKSASGEIWAAVPKAQVKVGDTVTVVRPQLMANFQSKTLKRTFASIYFGNLGKPGDDAAGKSGAVHGAAGPGGEGKRVAAAHGAAKGKKQDVGKIAKAAGGHTIAELFAQRAALAKKKVAVRGKVTKFNVNIMGKNWLHLQDGTGTEADKSFDLTVTTKAAAKVGDVVLVEGVLAVDKDFGAGYAYPAIVEDATIVAPVEGAGGNVRRP